MPVVVGIGVVTYCSTNDSKDVLSQGPSRPVPRLQENNIRSRWQVWLIDELMRLVNVRVDNGLSGKDLGRVEVDW